MAYILTYFWPGATEEQYRDEVAAGYPKGSLRKGPLHHAAGAVDGGVLISAIWHSQESSDRFVVLYRFICLEEEVDCLPIRTG